MTQYLCRLNLTASCDFYVALSINRIAPVESDHHRRVTHFSQACRHCPCVTIIEPQLQMLCTLCGLIVYADYRDIVVYVTLVAEACCVVVALMAAHTLTPDTLEIVLTWIVVSCSNP
jgi:hypothetical protein